MCDVKFGKVLKLNSVMVLNFGRYLLRVIYFITFIENFGCPFEYFYDDHSKICSVKDHSGSINTKKTGTQYSACGICQVLVKGLKIISGLPPPNATGHFISCLLGLI